MSKYGKSDRSKAGPTRPRRPPMWALNEAKHTTAIVVAHHHADVVTADSALAIAETAVAAVLNCMPRLLARGDTSPLTGHLTDPREAAGAMVRDPTLEEYEPRNVLIDVSKAVLLEQIQVAMAAVAAYDDDPDDEQPPVFALQLNGRINRAPDWARILYLFDVDGAATIVAELIALAMRLGPVLNAELSTAINTKLAQLMPQPPAPPERTTEP